VESDVADDDVVFGLEERAGRRIDGEAATRETLANVIVGIALQLQRDALGEKRPEALTGRARELGVNRAIGQQIIAPPLGDLVAERRADRAIDVADRLFDRHRLAALDRFLAKG